MPLSIRLHPMSSLLRSKFIAFSARAFSNADTNAPSASSSDCETYLIGDQVPVRVGEKGPAVGASRLDLLWADRLVAELKVIEVLAPIHWVPVRSSLKATGCHLGLLIRFNVPLLLRGVRRVILTGYPGVVASWRLDQVASIDAGSVPLVALAPG
jgi:hypothetical protein